MLDYYSAMVFITIMTMTTVLVHLFENQIFSRRVKNELKLISCFIIIGVMCEFFSIKLDNTSTEVLREIHGIIKAIEFTIAPIIPISYVRIISYRNFSKKLKILTNALLIFNGICEFLSAFVPFIFYIDEENVYNHGEYYAIYIIMYFSGIAIFIIEMVKYTRKYQSRNILTLFSILIFLLLGFSIRLIDSSIYSDWMVVNITYLMFVIYYSDLSLKVDALTDLLNRKSYEHRLKNLDYATAIIVLDANKFKEINDQYGHKTGDNILKIISKTLLTAYGKYGYCYRIGGDEFCVILKAGILEHYSNQNTEKNAHS